MTPGPKNSENTAVTFARKNYRNKRTKLPGPKHQKNTHPPALACGQQIFLPGLSTKICALEV
jgi:hypothetical protein